MVFKYLNFDMWALCFLFITILLYILYFIISQCDKAAKNYRNTINELHKACFENQTVQALRLIRMLPETVNHRHPKDGYTPIMRACLNGNTILVTALIHLGVDISLTSPNGETPFYLATFYLIQNPHNVDASCIRALFHAGSDINTKTNNGYTALHLAAAFGHTNLVKWLLKKGALTNIQPHPYYVAKYYGHQETANVFSDFN